MNPYNTFSTSSQKKEADLEKSDEERHGGESPRASISSAYFNVFNTIMSGGTAVLTMPSAAQWSGLVLFPVVVILGALLNWYTSDLLAIGADLSGSSDYASFVTHALGPSWAWITRVLFLVVCFGGGAQLVEAVMTSLSSVLQAPFLFWAIAVCGIALALLLVLPNMDSIAPLSKASTYLLIIFVCWVIYASAVNTGPSYSHVNLPWWPSSFANVANSSSMIFMGLGFQSNVIMIYAEMRPPKREGWVWSMPTAVATTAMCFIICGILPVLVHPFSNQTVVAQYSGPLFGKVLAILFGFSFTLSMPLMCVIGYRIIYDFLLVIDGGRLAESPLTGGWRIQLAKVCMCALVLAGSLLVPNIDDATTITGALVVCPLQFIIPALAFLRLSRNTDLDVGIYSCPILWAVAFVGTIMWGASLYSLHAL